LLDFLKNIPRFERAGVYRLRSGFFFEKNKVFDDVVVQLLIFFFAVE